MKCKRVALAWLLAGVVGVGNLLAKDGEPRTIEGAKPLIFIHYMQCYMLGSAGGSGESAERSFLRKDVEDFDNWPEKEYFERAWWSARLAPLAKTPDAIKNDLDLVEASGIDIIGLLISNRHLPNSQFAKGMYELARYAETHKVKLIPDVWDNFWDNSVGVRPIPKEIMSAYGKSVKDLMDKYPDAFYKRDGKWVISIGNPHHKDPMTWDEYQAFFEPWGGSQKFYIIMLTAWKQNMSSWKDGGEAWHRNVDVFSQWSANKGWGDPQDDVIFELAKKYGKDVCVPVSANYFRGATYYNLKEAGKGGKMHSNMAEDYGVSRMCDQWYKAIKAKTAWATVQTWNDFGEDHAITESNYRGQSLIKLTRYFADWFHAGKQPVVEKERVFLFHHRQLVDAKLSEPSILSHDDKWHLAPTVDYLNVVTILKKPAKVALKSGSTEWKLDAPAGIHQWLVYVPSPKTEGGPLKEAYTRADGSSYPVTTEERAVTATEKIDAGVPEVSISRQDKVVATLRSRASLIDHGKWQDLAMIGNEMEFDESLKK